MLRVSLMLMLLLLVTQRGAARTLGNDDSDQPLDRDDRVVGGAEVPQDSVNWVASLQFRGTGSHFCGGTVIGDYWVVTAAHCMESVDQDQFQVVTGGTDLDEQALQVRLPVNVTIGGYDENVKSRDLALIRLDAPLRASGRDTRSLVVSPAERRPEPGTQCMVLGWGYMRSGGSTVTKLRDAPVTVLSNEQCQEAFRNYGNYPITDTMLCAGADGRDGCQGDSGGPLVCRADGQELRTVSGDGAPAPAQLRLVGAVSWGVGCATPGLPGVYADVAAMGDWLQRAMAEMQG